MLYKLVARPCLFRLDPEQAHLLAMAGLGRVGRRTAGLVRAALRVDDPRLRVDVLGQRFDNPVGLAAGLDKHGEALPAWAALGLGCVEVGTVTPRPQPGNPRPRLFRLPQDQAIINRMGFNSVGAEAVRANLLRRPRLRGVVGINLGKNRDTPNERAGDDYVQALEVLHDLADYLVVNVSSPNTAGLRALQAPAAVADLVAAVTRRLRELAAPTGRAPVPVLVKLAPDFAAGELEDTAQAAVSGGAAGLIATNTTLRRDGLSDLGGAAESGGLSGQPLRDLATGCVRRVYRATDGRVPIIGVGGIFTAQDAYQKIRAGASLVQIYTGLIYEGPLVVRRLLRGLLALLQRDGLPDIPAARGLDAG